MVQPNPTTGNHNANLYGSYRDYNFYSVYPYKHAHMTTKDIEGAVPHPRGRRDPRHDPLNTADIDGAQPRSIMGYTGKHPEIIRSHIELDKPESVIGN